MSKLGTFALGVAASIVERRELESQRCPARTRVGEGGLLASDGIFRVCSVGPQWIARFGASSWASCAGATTSRRARSRLRSGLARLWSAPSRSEGVGLDLLFVDSSFLESVVSRATPVELGNAMLPVASVEDLLVMKLEANRPQDIDDILAIKDAFADRLDLHYVREQTERLGIGDRLALYFGHLPR